MSLFKWLSSGLETD